MGPGTNKKHHNKNEIIDCRIWRPHGFLHTHTYIYACKDTNKQIRISPPLLLTSHHFPSPPPSPPPRLNHTHTHIHTYIQFTSQADAPTKHGPSPGPAGGPTTQTPPKMPRRFARFAYSACCGWRSGRIEGADGGGCGSVSVSASARGRGWGGRCCCG